MIETVWPIFSELVFGKSVRLFSPILDTLRLTFYHWLMYTLGLNHISELNLKLP